MKGSQEQGEGKRGKIGCRRGRKERNQSPIQKEPKYPNLSHDFLFLIKETFSHFKLLNILRENTEAKMNSLLLCFHLTTFLFSLFPLFTKQTYTGCIILTIWCLLNSLMFNSCCCWWSYLEKCHITFSSLISTETKSPCSLHYSTNELASEGFKISVIIYSSRSDAGTSLVVW